MKPGKRQVSSSMVQPRSRPPARRAARRYPWSRWPDSRLLDLRLCDLQLTIEGSWLEACIERVLRELGRRGIRFRPHFWLSDEWFTPDGIPGVAVPFYLAHPRLIELERRQMLEAEGATRESCLKILRHEVGHALDHAYLLHRRRQWQAVFGRSSKPYPEYYLPRPHSRRYVMHLDLWYAQSHPDEDFAETFAVWLGPRGVWRRRYKGWEALRKLEFVDELMKTIAGRRPLVRSRARMSPVSACRRTLRDYYIDKRSRLARSGPEVYDQDLHRLFSAAPEHVRRVSAAAFLRRVRGEVRRLVSRWTGEYQYTLDVVLKEMIRRCRELNLHLAGPEEQVKTDFAILLTVQTMNELYSGHRRIAY